MDCAYGLRDGGVINSCQLIYTGPYTLASDAEFLQQAKDLLKKTDFFCGSHCSSRGYTKYKLYMRSSKEGWAQVILCCTKCTDENLLAHCFELT